MENSIESGVQLVSRLNTSKRGNLIGLNASFFGEEDLQNAVVEVISDYKTEKSFLLVDFIIKCILPSSLNESWKGCGVVLINTNFQISIFLLIKTMERCLKDQKIVDRKSVIESSLKNLIILNCFTESELEMTIYSLEEKILKHPNINCLVLDDITSFYWSKRRDEDERISFHTYSLNFFNLIYDKIKGLNLFLLIGRTENNDSHKLWKLSKNIDYKIVLTRKTSVLSTAMIQCYKTGKNVNVSLTYDKFKLDFMSD